MGNPRLEHGADCSLGASGIVYRGRAAGEDQALEALSWSLAALWQGMHLRVHAQLADTPGDKVGVLPSEIDDSDFFHVPRII